MTTITPAEMKELETRFMQDSGVPGILLMEQAAMGVADAIARRVPSGSRVLFLCGPGSNGGDGYAAARLWVMRGGYADVVEITPKARGDALVNRTLAQLYGVRFFTPDDDLDLSVYAAVVDALFGTGLSRSIEGDIVLTIHRVYDEMSRRPDLPIIAVDIPSGLDGATGEPLGEEGYSLLRATETVTFHRVKQGLLLREGPEFAGKITVCPLSIPLGGDHDGEFDGYEVLSPEELGPLFRRRVTLHKGDCGRAVLFCGSRGMAGAAALAAKAAIRSGAGLTTLLCRESLLPILQTLVPGATCVPLPEENGLLRPEVAQLARITLEKADAAAIGCGIGQSRDVLSVLRAFAEAECPVVWDADALNLLASHDGFLPLKESDVITPHPGEAARLLDADIDEITGDPLAALERLHDLCGCTVLLKGARSLIQGDDERYINLYGSPAMAKGGSGDVLTGILSGVLAQRDRLDVALTSTSLTAYAALIHGLAGQRAAGVHGENSILPEELADAIRLD